MLGNYFFLAFVKSTQEESNNLTTKAHKTKQSNDLNTKEHKTK